MKTVEEVCLWLRANGFQDYEKTFHENKIDGEALLGLTERSLELLIPIIGHRMKFLNLLTRLKDVAAAHKSQEEENQQEHQKRSHSIKERHAVSPTQKDVTLNARKPWPATLVLPTNFRPDVTRVLQAKEAGKMMEPKQRLSFIKTLYEHFSMYTLYPTRDQITAVAELIVRTYPPLKDKSIGTGYDSWFAQLYEKFRNERKQLKDDPEVILRKRQQPNSEGRGIPSKLRRGAVNWEPPFPEGEDEASMKRHKEMLYTEWQRRTRNHQKIKHGMMLTFPDRRRLINKGADLNEVRAEYPALFDYSQIISEFERILGLETSVLETFLHNFAQVTDSILTMARRTKKKTEKMAGLLGLLETDDCDKDEEEPTSDEKAQVAMAVLPYLLQSRTGASQLKDFVQFIPDESNAREVVRNKERPFPCIVFSGTLDSPGDVHLAAEKELLCTFSHSLVDATLALLATYYVFMFNYPPGLNNFFLYLQKCILQVQDGRKLPSTVISFVNSLDGLSQEAI